jgi:hypothetical protein
MSPPSILDKIVENKYCGSDPIGRSNHTDELACKYTTPILKEERITDSGQPTGESLRPLKQQDLSSMVACEKLKLADPDFTGKKHYNMRLPWAEAYPRLFTVN